ncbi:prepilin-type N-terminal cleavage/methylation domain-containing protein [Chitinilyticum litopenaei]|uniref:prepilin-type N-terminal cleavage/methylation domain-containing protein n=1 Tax=Chitinilyticum litopenaei TaxID=1121276 RepID=UPI00041FCFB1|nr:prepilin-type N-terminal cleavage/methylation domain-containing protein [Chitinilyticum litopenaei]
MKRATGPDRCRHGGFTLVEMAVVLLVAGLLLGMALGPLTAQLEARRHAETRAALAQAQEALTGYLLINKRLPCPADPALADTQGAAGLEDGGRDALGQCARLEGALPWLELGVPQLDGWGRRFTYRLSPAFSRQSGALACGSAAHAQPCFALTSAGVLTVRRVAGANLATSLPAVLLSHGANGAGAWQADGSQLPGAQGDELENADGDTLFVGRNADEGFDDLVVWLATPPLMSRLVSSGALP